MTRIFVEQALGIALVLGLLYHWTGMPEGSGGEVALSVLVILAALVLFAWLGRRAFRQLRGFPLAKVAWPVHLLLFPMTLGFAYWIAWWVPDVSSFGAQVASMAVRFGAGYLVAVAGWLALIRAIASARSLAK